MRKKKLVVGVLLGAVAGVLDVIPMVVQDMSWDANLSAFFHWVVVGFFYCRGAYQPVAGLERHARGSVGLGAAGFSGVVA